MKINIEDYYIDSNNKKVIGIKIVSQLSFKKIVQSF